VKSQRGNGAEPGEYMTLMLCSNGKGVTASLVLLLTLM